jgi:hypothetical protein
VALDKLYNALPECRDCRCDGAIVSVADTDSEEPVTDRDIARSLIVALRDYAADDDGYLRSTKRLMRVAEVRCYNDKEGWIYNVRGRHWVAVYQEMRDWHKQQPAR